MQNVFPIAEDVEIEEIYGIKRKTAYPLKNTKTYVFGKTQENNCLYKRSKKYKWFRVNEMSVIEKNEFGDLTEYLEIRNKIIALYNNTCVYLSLKSTCDELKEYDMYTIYKIYTFLDKLNIINYRDVLSEINVGLRNINTKEEVKKEIKANKPKYDLTKTMCKCGMENAYYSQSENICKICYNTGKYSKDLTSSDFVEINRDFRNRVWSKRDEIRLLEGIEKYGDDWVNVSKYVGNKSRYDCIHHFMMMPILETTFKDIGFNTQGCFLYTSNTITHILIFLSSTIHPSVASCVAKRVLKDIDDLNKNIMKIMLLEAKNECLKFIELETKKIERINNVLMECQINIINLKINILKNAYTNIKKTKQEILDRLKDENKPEESKIN